jgi:hypothetical protein
MTGTGFWNRTGTGGGGSAAGSGAPVKKVDPKAQTNQQKNPCDDPLLRQIFSQLKTLYVDPRYGNQGRNLNGNEWSQNFFGDASTMTVTGWNAPYSSMSPARNSIKLFGGELAVVHTHPLRALGSSRVQTPSNPQDYDAARASRVLNIMLSSQGIFTYNGSQSSTQIFGGSNWWKLPDCGTGH